MTEQGFFSAACVAFLKIADMRVEIDWPAERLSRSQNWFTAQKIESPQPRKHCADKLRAGGRSIVVFEGAEDLFFP
jgi:hypothetical protein